MPLSPGERAYFARWPDRQWRDHGTGRLLVQHADGRDYMRLLLQALLPSQRRVVIEAAIVLFADDVPYYECLVRLRSADRLVEMKAGGGNPAEARFNAELFAIRHAVLGEEVPVLGRLLAHRRLAVDLLPHKGDPSIAWWYDLVVTEDRRRLPWEAEAGASMPFALPEPSYTVPVSLQPASAGKRTRYLVVDILPADLARVVSPYMAIGETVYVHRLLLALQGKPISGVMALNPFRELIGTAPFEDEILHAHHINGVGYDDRQANLQPLTPAEHARRHEKWLRDYNDIAAGMQYRADRGVRGVLLAPPRVIVSPDHYDMETELVRVVHPSTHAASGRSPRIVRGDVYPSLPALDPSAAKPVTVAELAQVAGREDKAHNMVLVLRALVRNGGAGTFQEIKKSRSLWRVAENTVRRQLDSMIGARIIACNRLDRDALGGKGARLHYRLVRPLADDLQKLVVKRAQADQGG